MNCSDLTRTRGYQDSSPSNVLWGHMKSKRHYMIYGTILQGKTLISMRHGMRMKKMMICIELRGQTPISSLPYHEVNMTTGENIIYCTAVSFMKILLSQWEHVLPGSHCWGQNNGLQLCSIVSATQFWRSCTRKWNLSLLHFASE